MAQTTHFVSFGPVIVLAAHPRAQKTCLALFGHILVVAAYPSPPRVVKTWIEPKSNWLVNKKEKKTY